MLVAQPVEAKHQARAGIDLSTLSLALLGAGPEPLARVSLDGKTLDETYEWMGSVVAQFTEGLQGPLQRRDYDMPPHPVATGTRFSSTSRAESYEPMAASRRPTSRRTSPFFEYARSKEGSISMTRSKQLMDSS